MRDLSKVQISARHTRAWIVRREADSYEEVNGPMEKDQQWVQNVLLGITKPPSWLTEFWYELIGVNEYTKHGSSRNRKA